MTRPNESRDRIAQKRKLGRQRYQFRVIKIDILTFVECTSRRKWMVANFMHSQKDIGDPYCRSFARR